MKFKVKSTGKVGKLCPCPCGNPIPLVFKDGEHCDFNLTELEPTIEPITRLLKKRDRRKDITGHLRGQRPKTVAKLLKILEYLKAQHQPVTIRNIQDAFEFPCVHFVAQQPTRRSPSLESLGLVTRHPTQFNNRFEWTLTCRGRLEGERIIKELYIPPQT